MNVHVGGRGVGGVWLKSSQKIYDHLVASLNGKYTLSFLISETGCSLKKSLCIFGFKYP